MKDLSLALVIIAALGAAVALILTGHAFWLIGLPLLVGAFL